MKDHLSIDLVANSHLVLFGSLYAYIKDWDTDDKGLIGSITDVSGTMPFLLYYDALRDDKEDTDEDIIYVAKRIMNYSTKQKKHLTLFGEYTPEHGFYKVKSLFTDMHGKPYKLPKDIVFGGSPDPEQEYYDLTRKKNDFNQ